MKIENESNNKETNGNKSVALTVRNKKTLTHF